MKDEHAISEITSNPEMGEENDENPRVKNEGLAAVLSLLLPGVGHFYNGNFIWGIIWFLITPGLWIGTGGMLGWVCHIISGIQAYNHAQRKNEAHQFGNWDA